MFRKLFGYVLLAAMLVGGVVCLALGLEIWLGGAGGRIGGVMMAAGAAIAGLAGYTLAEDFAGRFLRLAPRAPRPGKAASLPILPPPDCH